MSKRARTERSTKGQTSSSQEPSIKDKVCEFEVFDNDTHQGYYDTISRHQFIPKVSLTEPSLPLMCGNSLPLSNSASFLVGGMVIKKVRDSRVKLSHCCIATTTSGRKDSTQRITSLDLFFLYCIYGEGVTCNIPYWLARYLEKVKKKDLLAGGTFMTKIAKSFGLLTNLMIDTLSVEPQAHVCKARWMDQQDEHWGLLNTWIGQQEEQANWMYDHTVRHFRYLSTHDNLDPHLQIDPFPEREADYPPYGYTGHMPSGYEYRSGPAPPGGFE
nr:hypothetical protein [Tanacetum cinerariifolium]